MKKFISVCFLFALIFSLSIFPSWGSADIKPLEKPQPTQAAFQAEPLPKEGNIAVQVKSMSDHDDTFIVALVTRQLLAKGYKVVGQNRLAAIRKNLAANENEEVVLDWDKKYGVVATIKINAKTDPPVENEFRLYTGTSSVVVMVVTSEGSVVYTDTVKGKQVGYTPDEATYKSIERAVLLAVDRMTQ